MYNILINYWIVYSLCGVPIMSTEACAATCMMLWFDFYLPITTRNRERQKQFVPQSDFLNRDPA